MTGRWAECSKKIWKGGGKGEREREREREREAVI
jgi:hypothetical protein